MATIIGTSGNDTVQPGFLSAGVTGADASDPLSGDDVVSGLAGDDNLDGGAGDDSLTGGDGNDTLAGGAGRDTLRGGLGNDVLLLADATPDEVVDGGAGFDTANFFASFTNYDLTGFTLAGIEALQFNFGGEVTLTSAQLLALESFAGTLYNLRGDDAGTYDLSAKTFIGQGFDQFNGSAGNDVIVGREIAMTIAGNAGDDRITGGDGNDNLQGGEGDDTLEGAAGDDNLDGGEGDDVAIYRGLETDFEVTVNGAQTIVRDLRAGAPQGTDTLFGVETIRFVPPTSMLVGTPEDDTLLGAAADDLIKGRRGADLLAGSTGNDTIRGGGGADTMDGGDGDDRLLPGAGRDVLTGGAGRDAFIFAPDSADRAARPLVTITDFDRAAGERLNLRRLDADLGTDGDQAFAFIGRDAFSGTAGELRWQREGADVLVLGDTDGDGLGDLRLLLEGQERVGVHWFVL